MFWLDRKLSIEEVDCQEMAKECCLMEEKVHLPTNAYLANALFMLHHYVTSS